VEPSSTRPWLGVGAALSGLPAAGGCFCAALVLAVVADSDPGAVYEQHRWLGAIVAASAVCAFVAMMGWATLRHGGLPVPVLLIALALSGAPFLLPGGLLLPAAAIAVAGCAVLATVGLLHPPASPEVTRVLVTGLAGTAVVLAVGQAFGVGLTGATPPPQARVLADAPHRTQTSSPAKPGRVDRAPVREKPAKAPVAARETPAPEASAVERPVIAPDTPAVAIAPPAAAPDPVTDAAPDAVAVAARAFVRDYYAALDGGDFAAAWQMLSPEVQRAFGGFAGWRKGYARTVSHAPGNVTVTPAGAGAAVGLTLRAGDRGACGDTVERRFAVTWRLAPTPAGWRATAASARKISGPEPC
jgi:hypothetical protein